MKRKNFGETTIEKRHKVFLSGKEDKHEHDVGFLVHKDIVNTIMGCRPVSSRLISIRQWAVPFNITVVQAYAPTSDYDDNEVEECYDQPGWASVRIAKRNNEKLHWKVRVVCKE